MCQLAQLGNVSMAVNEIKAFLTRHPVTPQVVRQLLMRNSRDCKEYAEPFQQCYGRAGLGI